MTLVFYATHGFHIRNLLDSGLVRELVTSFRVVILTDPADIANMVRDYGDLAEIRGVSWQSRPLETRLEFVRKRIVVKPSRAVTTSVFSEQERRDHPLKYNVLRWLNCLLGRSRLIRETWLRLERWLIPGIEFDAILGHLRPALVVTANYGTDPGTIRLLRSAHRQRLKTLAIVPSFDNLTSKGVMGARPDHLIVWNDTMLREAIELHDFAPNRVDVCGGLQFDIYARTERHAPRDAICKELGLDPSRPTIVVGTITPVYFPFNIDVIELIADAIESGELPDRCQILVRLHPQVVDGGQYGDDLESYREICRRYSFVLLDIPKVRSWHSMQPPPKGDMARLATILRSAVAVVVPASTLALDAAAVDTPVIGVGFDGHTCNAGADSVGRMFQFTHYLPITESGALTLARSRNELVSALQHAMKDRSALSAARTHLATAILGPRDGNALTRVCEVIGREVLGPAGQLNRPRDSSSARLLR